MEINITRFVTENNAFEFSASQMELGVDAGRITWDNAKQAGADAPLLTTPEELEALRDYMRGYGNWEDAEIDAWDDDECNALFIQLISGDLREMEGLATDDDGGIDWSKAEDLAQQGVIAGNIYRGDDGAVYYSLGS